MQKQEYKLSISKPQFDKTDFISSFLIPSASVLLVQIIYVVINGESGSQNQYLLG